MLVTKNLYNKEEIEKVPTRDGYGKGIVEAAQTNEDIVCLCADLTESTRSHWFQEEFPERFFEVGIQEQNMMGVAAGMALAGKIPFVSSYAVFSPGRNWDQLRVSVCYSEANVKVVGAHAGVSVGPDGATHQALEDIAITRVLPNMTVLVPCDFEEAKKATIAATKINGPVYLRLTREKSPVFTTEKTPFEIGKAQIFKTGTDVTIVGCGPLMYKALLAAKKLETDGVSAEVINCHTIKPLDEKTLLSSIKKTGAVVTVEEHQVVGGLRGVVAELTSKHFPVPVEEVGMQDQFGVSGDPEELYGEFGMTEVEIAKACKVAIKRKK